MSKLRYARGGPDLTPEQRTWAQRHPLYALGDVVMVYVNEGDLYIVGEEITGEYVKAPDWYGGKVDENVLKVIAENFPLPQPEAVKRKERMKLIAVNGASGLISIRQAARLGIERLRQPNWSNPLDHIKIDLLKDYQDGKLTGEFGPWIHLYAPFNKECNGRDPVDMLAMNPPIDVDAEGMERYTGPLPDSNEYKADVAKYDGCIKDTRSAPSASPKEPT